MFSQRNKTIAAALALALIVAWAQTLAANNPTPLQLMWRPLVILLGDGDSRAAIAQIKKQIEMFDTILHRSHVDDYTKKFADNVQKTLYSFDLDDFYRKLPEQTETWRWLALEGRIVDNRFLLGRSLAPTMHGASVSGPEQRLGDMSVVLRGQPIAIGDGKKKSLFQAANNYLLQTQFAMVLGDIDWQRFINAAVALLRTPQEWRPSASPATMTTTVILGGPDLFDPKIAEILQALEKAFPEMYKRLTNLGTIESITISQPAGETYQRIQGRVRMKPKILGNSFEEFADFLESLDRLVKGQLGWIDANGRHLFFGTIDSDQLIATFELVALDGKLVPFSGSQVFAADVIDPMGEYIRKTRLMIEAHMRVMGLKVDVKNLEVNIDYRPTPARAVIASTVTRIPQITFSGAALGLMSPAMIDLFIPGNLDQLTYDFMKVATSGNQGRGIAVDVAFGRPQPDRLAAIETAVGFEALNNFMVKFAMRVGIDRFVPDEDQRADIGKFITSVRDGFTKDMYLFESAGPQE